MRPKIKYIKRMRLPVGKITERWFTKCESPLPSFNYKYGSYNIYEDEWIVYYNTKEGWYRYNKPYRLVSTNFIEDICLSQKELSILKDAKKYLSKKWRRKLSIYELQQSGRRVARNMRRISYRIQKRTKSELLFPNN